MPMTKSIRRMLGLAYHVADWSAAPAGRRHGCVLAVDGKYVVSTGYNGPPRGEGYCTCGGEPKDFCAENCKAVHAEINSIANLVAIGGARGPIMAFVTKKPCDHCRGVLKNAGVVAMFWDEPEFFYEVFDGTPVQELWRLLS